MSPRANCYKQVTPDGVGGQHSAERENACNAQPEHGALQTLRDAPRRRRVAVAAWLLLLLGPIATQAQLEVVCREQPPRVFSGEARQISLRLHNPSAALVTADLHTRLYQASSGTAAPLGEAPWKQLTVLPGQTVLESVSLSFPQVKTETKFVVQWLEGTNKVVGTSEVLAYPADLLKELRPLAGDQPLSVLDPQNQLKPLLKAAGVEYQDLEDSSLEDGQGKLAILGPFQSRAQMQEGLVNWVKGLAQKGVAVVWIEPPAGKRAALKPSYYTVRHGQAAVLVVQAGIVAQLAENPQAQLNLVELCRRALHPEPLQLPEPTPTR